MTLATTRLHGYAIAATLYASPRTIVYRGVREADGRSVALKTLNNDHPSSQELASIRREYDLLQRLSDDGIVAVYDLIKHQYGLAMVLEEFGGMSLDRIMASGQGRLDLSAWLDLAIRITEVLGRIHQQGIIHKDVTPANILWNRSTNVIKIIDFDIASQLKRERQVVSSDGMLEGSLPYISPEQTGRMNRDIDYRTDFYSLGVTLYELLFNELPFHADDVIGWVYNHIATPPPFAESPEREAPSAVIAILEKLLAKNAEDRYQSSRGLLHDLEKCRSQWKKRGAISRFRLGEQDRSGIFQISRKLYGRDWEIGLILELFEKARRGGRELVLVAGYAGVGKTSLVGELQRTIIQQRGFYLEGKFDQYERGAPFSAIASAFRGFVLRLLALPDARLAEWKAAFIAALGLNARIIVEFIPEFEKVVGAQNFVQELNPSEAHNRFLIAFRQFMSVVATDDHPVALFLDDLQWSDAATLDLIEFLATMEGIAHLLLIGAYRDQEVDAGHRLRISLDSIQKQRTAHELLLRPLNRSTLNRIVAETLHCTRSQSRLLATILYQKTQGNPFFFTALLGNLYEEGYLTFDYQEGQWVWDPERIRGVPVSDNVVEFVVRRLQQMPEDTRESLKFASCIGESFDLKTLSVIQEQPAAAIARSLLPATEAGVVDAIGRQYRVTQSEHAVDDDGWEQRLNDLGIEFYYCFRHDRVQQAAGCLIDEGARHAIHLDIGRHILRHATAAEAAEQIIEIVRHLNEGKHLLTSTAERIEVARLNLAAAKKANAATAYRAALSHLEAGIELLPADSWSKNYDLAFQLHREYCECAYICRQFGQAETCSKMLIERSRSNLEKAEIYAMQVVQYNTIGQVQKAIEIGLAGCALMGVDILRHKTIETARVRIAEIQQQLSTQPIAGETDTPVMDDAEMAVVMRMLSAIALAAYVAQDDVLFCNTVIMAMQLTIAHDPTPDSAFAYVTYGSLVGSLQQDYRAGVELGQRAMELNEQFNDLRRYCSNLFLYTTVVHGWRFHWTTLGDRYRNVIQRGWESGDLLYLAYACINVIQWDPEMDLETQIREGERYLAIIREIGYRVAIDLAQVIQHWRLNLRGGANGQLSLSSGDFDEFAALERAQASGFRTGILPYCLYKMQVCYFYENYAEAAVHGDMGQAYLSAVRSQPYTVEFSLYVFLTWAAQYLALDPASQLAAKTKMGAEHGKMQIWADTCPENFLHLRLIMDAELARIAGDHEKAAQCYDQAIVAANANRYIRYEALANELTAKFYLGRDQRKLAGGYMNEALYLYSRWGATAKVQQLRDAYPNLPRLHPVQSAPGSLRRATAKSGAGAQAPDMNTIVKASQALSEEVALDKLLPKFMSLVRENAGAKKVLIALQDDSTNELRIQEEWLDGGAGTASGANEENVPMDIMQYVARTRHNVILGNAAGSGDFGQYPYVRKHKPKSLLCMPILNQGKLLGVLYLEHRHVADVFTTERLDLLGILASQAAISIQNAYLYTHLEDVVRQRTAELNETNQELIRLARDKSEFMSMAAHDLKSPLASIRGLADMVRATPADFSSAEIARYMESIRRSSNRMLSLIKDLLKVNAIESGEIEFSRQTLDVRDLVRDVADRFREGAAAKKIALKTSLPANRCVIHADENAIVQVLENLLSNAVKYSSADTTITVTLRSADGVYRCRVRDGGPGLAEADLRRIFEKYARSKASPTGGEDSTGLGLYIAKKLVEAMQGKVWCESIYGQGSTFIVELPIAE